MALPPVPMRLIFRSRYAALLWAAGICLTAYEVAGGNGGTASVDAANSADSNAAQLSALLAEDAS